MSEGLPAGFTIKADSKTPALPQGFVVKDTVKNNAPITADNDSSESLGLGGIVAKGIATSPIARGVNALFGKDSEIGRLSEDEQLSYLQDEITNSQANLENDEKQLERIKVNQAALGGNDPEINRIVDQFEKRVEHSRKRVKKANEVFEGDVPLPTHSGVKTAVAGGFKSFLNAFGESLPKAAGAVQATFTGQNPEDTAAFKAGEAFGAGTDQILHTDAARAAQTGQQVAEGLGQAASFITPAAGVKAVGFGVKGQRAVMASLGAAQGGAAGVDEAIAFDADNKKKLLAFYGNAGLGLSEAIPLSRLFSRLNRASGGKVNTILKNATAEGMEEALQEVGQTIGSNAIASELAKYDEGRKLLDGAGEAGKIGGIIGAILGAGGGAIARQNPSETQADQGQAPELPEGFTVREQNDDVEPAAIINIRPFKRANAFDADGGKTKVEYAIVEMDDLITSHDDDMNINPKYPQALQPRDRSRKSSETQVNKIASRLNPEQLGETPDAGGGAMIISANGVVESGNGRTLGLRKVYNEGGEKAEQYKAWLKSQKYPVKGFSKPVLVRVADPNRSDQERVSFTRRANATPVADMSVTERGIADARSLSPQDFDLAKTSGADTIANIDFVRQVLTKTTTEAERGKLIDKNGRLSVDGKRRVEAAVASYAYEDPAVISDLIETTDKTLRSIGDVMVSVAPHWAALRADIEATRVDERVNIVPNIIEAARIISDARNSGASVQERTELIKADMFNESGAIDPITSDVLKTFYDEATGKQRDPKQIIEDLKYYTQEASKVLDGPDIFGDRQNDDPARRILSAIEARRGQVEQKTREDDFEASPVQEQVFLPEGFTVKGEAAQDAETDTETETEERDPNTAELFDRAPAVESAAFNRWFGESKVVDPQGRPLVVYHGSEDARGLLKPDAKFEAKYGSDDLFFFTDSRQIANTYTDKPAFDYQNSEPAVLDFYVSLQNPMIIDGLGQKWNGHGKQMEYVAEAKEKGHDGIIIRNTKDAYHPQDGGKSDVFIAFKPNQIKSAMTDTVKSRIDGSDIGGGANRGTFDPNDDRILFDKAPAIQELPEGFVLKDDITPTEPKPKQLTRGRQKRRAVETPEGEAVGINNPKAVGLHDITNEIKKSFGAIARQGRMGRLPKEVRGFYKPKTGVIRTRQSYLAEIDTFAHEVGHSFEFNNKDKGIRDIMEMQRTELVDMDYEKGRKDKKVALSEGFAEFFTAYITNPAYARAQAPKFAKRFDKWLDKNYPSLRPQINEFSRQYNDYLTAPSATSVASNIVQHPKTGIKKTIQKAKDQGKESFAGTVVNQTIERVIDRTNPMKLVVNELKKIYRENTGRSLDLKAVDDPYKIIRLSMNASSTGVMDMMQGVAPYQSIEHEGPSLRDAIEKAVGDKKSWNAKNTTDFDAYLIARRAVQEYKRYLSGEISNPPTINSLADHKQAIADYEKSNPQFKEAAQMIYEYQSRLWKKRLDAGLITQELYDITTERQDYVPFRRDMSDQGSIKKLMNGVTKNTKFAGGAKHFDGSSRPILSPLQSIMEDTINSAKVIAQNDSLKALVNLANKAGKNSSSVVEVIPRTELKGAQVDVIEAMKNRLKNTSFSEEDQASLVQELSQALDEDGLTTVFKSVEASEKGENIVYVWQDGQRQPLLVGNPELAMDVHSMMMGLNDEASNTFVNMLAVPTTTLRMGITNHPMFIATNFIRDQLTTWVQSDAGFMPFVDGFRGVAAEITNNKYAKAYNTMAGVSGGVNVSAFKKGAIDKDLNQMRSRGIQVRRLWRLSEMSKLGDISESATRLGLFTKFVKKFKKEGMTDHEAFFEAAFEATDVMDFSMHGGQMNAPRRLIPFLNAQIVGLYKTGRTLAPGGVFETIKPYVRYKMSGDNDANLSKEEIRKIELGAKAWAKVAAIGLIGLSLSAMHDDDEEYLEFNEYYRSTHWITKIGGEWVLIPKPFELAALSNLFERSYEAFKLKDETAFKKFRKGMRDMLKPPMSIPAIGVPIEQILNKTFFNKAPIVPYGTEAYAPYAQYSANTSIFARRMGKLLGWSPARIDHAIKGFGATMGRDALRISDAVSGEKPSLSPSNTPVISRLVKNPNFGATSRNEMFKRVGQQSGKWVGLSRQLKNALEDEDKAEVKTVLSHVKDADQAAYVISHAIYDGKKVALKRMHPMRRAADGSQILRKARKAIVANEFEGVDLTRDEQRDLSEVIIKLDVAMSRNGLKYSNQKGFKQKGHTDEAPLMAEIERISPKVHKAIKSSMAKKKITREHEIEKKYSRLKRRLEIDAKKLQ